MKSLTFVILILFALECLAQNKALFDLSEPGLHKTLAGSTLSGYEFERLQNERTELTMISGGYFTIGTSDGVSASGLDDRCQITFGHPFAMTSFPVFSIDGVWRKIDEYFVDPGQISPNKDGEALTLAVSDEGSFTLRFSISSADGGQTIRLDYKITNLDTIVHSFGLGLMFDPALGKWGDGHLQQADGFLQSAALFSETDIPTSLILWERSHSAKGIGVELSFAGTPPDQLIAGNWAEIYPEAAPVFEPSELGGLYDLHLKMHWTEEELLPAAEKSCQTLISLKEPDFSSPVFMRWDIPAFLSMENGLRFPIDLKTSFEIQNLTGSVINNSELALMLPSVVNSASTSYSVGVPANQPAYRNIDLTTNLIYEDLIVELNASLISNGQVLDEIRHNIYLPATPVSDTGLVIIEDSISIATFPDVDLIFGVAIEKTSQPLFNLGKENLFLYENGARIREFTLGKHASAGSNLADVAFVLDCSGSMGDNINQVRNNLNEFADSLRANGYDYRIGVVTFSTTVDDVWEFTDNIEQVKQNLASINLWGGIEDSPAALYRATELSWRPGSRRTIIWITDEPYPEKSYTKKQVVDRMLAMEITVHGVGQNNLQTDWFNPIVIPCGGNFYDIYGNFRDIMLDVSRFKAQYIYKLTFTSSHQQSGINEIKLEAHYGGLGCSKSFVYELPSSKTNQALKCFPNPFNPEITLMIEKPADQNAFVSIYNVLGQRVKSFTVGKGGGSKIVWNAGNEQGAVIGSGFYIVELTLMDAAGVKRRETAKILYLK